jgi:acetyl esterase/lipase
MTKILLSLSFASIISFAFAQKKIPLYAGKIPNAKPTTNYETAVMNDDSILIISKITQPQIAIFTPPAGKANGTSVIIFPGGGYYIVAAGHEGYDVAKQFNAVGVTVFVITYRMPEDSTMINKEIGPLQDAQRAIQWVREHAATYHLRKDRVGILGFSAGGHLASTAATHFKKAYIENKKQTNLRPDFVILGYPVISFTDSIGHIGSRNRLLGEHPTAQKIKEYSNEQQVTKETPPCFLMHAKDDSVVLAKNSLLFAEALRKNKIENEVFLFENGGHGFGLNNPTSKMKWLDKAVEWMRKNGWMGK